MSAQTARKPDQARAARDEREIALDLTADEVVLHEGSARRGWRRFAGVAVEDPEFLGVMGLLRAEAESEVGAGRPVRIWLPEEQVLKLSLRAQGEEQARIAAAFREASRATGHAAQDLAVALAAPGPDGTATLLVAYAATWREARDYATRWGFVPGPVSTRHHAEAFAPAGPVFRLLADAPGSEQTRPRPPSWLALALAASLWAALAHSAAASPAPGTAPMPRTRAGVAAVVALQGPQSSGGWTAVLPPRRPGRPALVPGPRAVQGRTAPRATASAGRAGGLAAPLPVVRPARAAPPNAQVGAVPVAMVSRVQPAATSSTAPSAVRAPARPFQANRAALVGVVDFDTGREAFIRLPGGAFRTVRVGDVLEGWTVSVIGHDTLQLRRGAQAHTLLLVSR